MSSQLSVNPALVEWTGHEGLPHFDRVHDADFGPAFDAAMELHDGEIDQIANNPEPPTFANTIVALEIVGDELSRVSSLFWSKAGAHTNDVIQGLSARSRPRCRATIRRSA